VIEDDEFKHFVFAAAELTRAGAISEGEFVELVALGHHPESRCESTELVDIKAKLRDAGLSSYIADIVVKRYFVHIPDGFKAEERPLGLVDLGDGTIPVLLALDARNEDGSRVLFVSDAADTTERILEIIQAVALEQGLDITPTDQSFLKTDGKGRVTRVTGGINGAFNGKTSETIDAEADAFIKEMANNPFFASTASPDWGSPDTNTRKENPHDPH